MSGRRPAARLLAWLLWPALLIGALVVPRVASSAPDCGPTWAESAIGVSPGGPLMSLPDRDLARELDLARAAGLSAVRLDINWASIEPTRGNRNWDNTDRVVEAIVSRGMCPLGLLSHTPQWATNPDDHAFDSHFRPADPAVFADFAGAAAEHYRASVTAWEIWNEPNTYNFFKPAPSVHDYGQLLAAAYRAITAVDPHLIVISGGLAPAVDSATNIAPPSFLAQLYDGGYHRYFDGVGMHPYSYPALPTDPGTGDWNAAQQLPLMHDIMVGHGDGAGRIWITECGAPTGTSTVAVSDAVQAQTLQAILHMARQTPWLGPAFVYSLRDAGTDLNAPEDNFGIVGRDFTPKPAYAAVQGISGAT